MLEHHEVRTLPYSVDQMYALVTDVARYAEFLPWVRAVRVRSNTETEMLADLIVGFKAIKERFTSRVTKVRPTRVHVDYIEGPLKFLRNEWEFSPTPDGGCHVDFVVAFAFKNRLFEAIAGQMFETALRRMIGAFEARAAALYGGQVGVGINSDNASSAA